MSLYKVNSFILLFLTIIVIAGFYSIEDINKKYFNKEKSLHIKGDILELGYSVAKSIEQDGMNSTLNLLYKSLATHREYKTISITHGDKVIISTDRKLLNTSITKLLHLDKLNEELLYKDIAFFHEFYFFDKKNRKELNIVIDLANDYLVSIEKEINYFINLFLIFFISIILIVFALIFFFNVRPLIRLNDAILKETFESNNFFIQEHNNLYYSFKEKYENLKSSNQTLEQKVFERTESLESTNNRFNEAQQLTHLGNWEWDIISNKLSWSDEIYRIFGLRPQEFSATYDAFINTIHIDDRATVQASVNNALDTGGDYSIRHRIVLPNGVERIVQENARVELDNNKKPIRMIGTVQDITENFKNEKELEVQANILNAISDSIFVHNLDGTIIYANKSAYTNRGYTKEELLNMKVQELDYHDVRIGRDIYDSNLRNIHEQVEEKGEALFEVSHKGKNNIVIPLEITARLVKEEEKTYLISIARDITERKRIQLNLRESERKYRHLVENSLVGIFNSTITGEIRYVNSSLVHMFGYSSSEEMIQKNAIHRYRDSGQRVMILKELSKYGYIEGMELEIFNKDNEIKHLLLSAVLEDDILSGMVMDITETKKAVEELTKLSKVIEDIDDIVMISDQTGTLTFVNNAYIEHTGFSREESIGKTASILKSGKHDKSFYQNLWNEILMGNVFREVIVNRKKDGEIYYEEKTITPIKNEKGEITSFVSTGKDITSRITMQQELEKLATTDKLTGIYNRHMFEKLIKSEMDRANRYKIELSLIMFDIDHFKRVNDTYGHDNGDKVLINISNIIKKHIRTTDIFARWGGEEFLILCPETNSEQGKKLAEKLRYEVETNSIKEVGKVTASFGLTHYVYKESEDEFLKRVDSALYKAKESGRNRVIVF